MIEKSSKIKQKEKIVKIYDKKTTIPVTPTTRKQIRVIVCDDELSNLKGICNNLKKIETIHPELEIVSESVTNGLECMYKIHKDFSQGIMYNILLIDENMPVMSGTMCINNLKIIMAKKELNNIDIISITSYQDENIRKQMLAIGCCEILSKPVRYKVLEKFILEYSKKIN